MKQILIDELSKLLSLNHVDKKSYHQKSKSMYLGDHVKAGIWIPPGGHIEFGENPVHTVIREMQEELKYKQESGNIVLFDVSIIDIIDNPRSGKCKTHFDLWYLVEMERKIDFQFDRPEFKEAKWFTFEDGIQKVTNLTYNKIIRKLVICS